MLGFPAKLSATHSEHKQEDWLVLALYAATQNADPFKAS